MAVEQGQEEAPLAERRNAALERATALASGLRARIEQTESSRSIPAESIEELLASGLFGILKPRVFGGLELGIAALVDVTTELASACGSTGWVYGVLAGHSWMVNLFPVEAQREVFADPNALTATVFRLNGKLTPEPGGYRLVDGAGRFCSGIDYVSWVMIGNAVVAAGQAPEPRFFLVPREDIEIVDDWHAVGMRGTGSRSIRIAETFIPAHRSVSLDDVSTGKSPGARFHAAALYQMPFQLIAPFSLIGAPLGVARGALEEFTRGFRRWLDGRSEVELAAESATLARIAHSAADIDAAQALVREDARRIDGANGADSLSAVEKARFPRDWAFAAQTARRAVSRLYESAGGAAVYDSSSIQRLWRDANAAAQHYAFIWDNAMADYGRSLMGLAPLHSIPKRR
jgi:alkylation response protein AidB-like acyl-CoA dehydrogenase